MMRTGNIFLGKYRRCFTNNTPIGIVEECECRFTSSSLPGESKRNGVVVMVSFQVLVKPIKRSAEFDQNIVNLRQGVESGETSEIVDDIEKVPNEWLADALGAKK